MRKLFLLSALALSVAFTGCGNSGEKKQDDGVAPDTSKGVSAMAHDSLSKDATAVVYVCPCGGCPEIRESKPGNCSKCQMELAVEKK